MKTKASSKILLLALLVLLVGTMHVVGVVRANWIPAVIVQVWSPVDGQTYQSTPILVFTVNFNNWYNRNFTVAYSIDGQNNVSRTGSESDIESFIKTAFLPKLSEGEHQLRVYAWVENAEGSAYFESSKSSEEVHFIIDSAFSPESHASLPVTINSPESRIYNSSQVPLSFTANSSVTQIEYRLDSGDPVVLPFSSSTDGLNLSGLSEGNHVLLATATGSNWLNKSDLVYFAVDTVAPNISVLSPQNQTYTTTDVSLCFYVDDPFSLTAYVLDGGENVTVDGNTTLTLSGGVHSLRLCTEDTAGNTGTSETLHFAIEQVSTPSAEPTESTHPETTEPSPKAPGVQADNSTPAVILVALFASASVVGVLIYLGKRKK